MSKSTLEDLALSQDEVDRLKKCMQVSFANNLSYKYLDFTSKITSTLFFIFSHTVLNHFFHNLILFCRV